MIAHAPLPNARPVRTASAQFADRYSTSGRRRGRLVEPRDRLAPRVFHQRVVAQQVARRAASAARTGACRRSRPGRAARDRAPRSRSRRSSRPARRAARAPRSLKRRLIQQHAGRRDARRGRRGRAAGAAATARSARRARRPSSSRSARRRRPRRRSSRRARARRRARTRAITRSFSSGFSRPCSSATRYSGNTSCLQVIGHLRRRAQVDLLRLLDQRIDHVGLAARARARCAHEPIDLVAPRLRLRHACGSAAGPAAGRESPTRRDRRTPSARACAESASRSSPARRDSAPLRAQRRALHHAEAMLLVDDDEAQLLKRDGLLGQRVRADDQVHRAARELRQHLAPLRGASTLPVSSATRNRERVEQPRESSRKCWSARISVGAMNATCRPFSIATTAASSATMVLPAPTSPCSSRFIGSGAACPSTISLERRLLAGGELERQHPPRRLADAIVDDHGAAAFGRPRAAACAAPARPETGRTLRRSAAAAPACESAFSASTVGAGRREMRVRRAPAARSGRLRAARIGAGSGSGKRRRQSREQPGARACAASRRHEPAFS